MKATALPELKEILGALIFAADRSLKAADMKRCIDEVASAAEDGNVAFGNVTLEEVSEAIKSLGQDIERTRAGFRLVEVAGGFRLQTSHDCAAWVKHLLNIGKPNRLTPPGLETLAIVAYRQPITKAEIEHIRGVSVDHVLKQLMELRLVKLAARSDLPGRPFLYATTKFFLEHFGLSGIEELRDIDPALAALKGLHGGAAKTDNGRPVEYAVERSGEPAPSGATNPPREAAADTVALPDAGVAEETKERGENANG